MSERYMYNKQIRNAPIRRRLDHRFITWVMVAACLGGVLTFGFVYSARCQVEAMALGYETQERRAELERAAEHRRMLELELQRESSPALLEKRARKLGLCLPDMSPAGAAVAQVKSR
jgi:hypothetical protein